MSTPEAPERALQQQARALGDPTRHAIFRHLVAAGVPCTVAELTEHFGLNHNAIRQHLAKLVAAGLVTEATAPATGRGRPKLLFAPAPDADSRWGAVGPYERLSRLLAQVIRTGDTPLEVGRREGRRLREASAPPWDIAFVESAMAKEGFAPMVRRKGARVDIVLERCPFESTALGDPDTVCALHLGLAEGLVDGPGDVRVDDLVAKDPRRAGCRLRLRVEPEGEALT